MGCSSWGRKESDTTEQLTLSINTHTHTHTHIKEYYSASRKKEGNSAIYNNIDEPRGHYVKYNKPASILDWSMPWTEEPGGPYSPQDLRESDTTK